MTKSLLGRSPTLRIRSILVGGLAEQVAAEQQAGADLLRLPGGGSSWSRVNGASGRTARGKPNQLGSVSGVASGRIRELLQVGQAFVQRAEVVAAGFDEAGQLLELGHADRGLHVGGFEVVADVRVGVLVVVTRRAGRPAASRSACRRCCPCRGRTSSRGPSRGSDSTSVLSRGLLVSTQPPSPMVM